MQNEYEIGAFISQVNIAQGLSAYDEADKVEYEKLRAQNDKLPPLYDLTGGWSHVIDGGGTIHKNLRDDAKIKEQSEHRIKYRIREFSENPKMAIRFFARKQLIGWCSPDFDALQAWGVKDYYSGKTSNPNENPYLFSKLQPGHKEYKALFSWADGYESVVYAASFIAAVALIRNRKKLKSGLTLTLPLVFLGQFMLSFFTESGGRFNFYAFVLILPYAAAGLAIVYSTIQDKISAKISKSIALQQPKQS